MFVRFHLLLLLVFYGLVYARVEIRDANVGTISRGDIGMIFYLSVYNTDRCTYAVKVNMISCTEYVTDRDKDSSYMYLIGGHMGHLKPRCHKNLTILYPTMYMHNRRGFCIISVKFKSERGRLSQKKANITFDTWLTKRNPPAILRDYYSKSELRTCDTVDLDPLDRCNPVDCHMKYLGTRNYFNRNWKRCQKVPICIADTTKPMPDVVYTLTNNKCRDFEKTVSRMDFQQIEAGTLKGWCEEPYGNTANIVCHYGKVDNETGLCVCDNGWESSPLERDHADNANLFRYHMCNIEVPGWYDTSARKVKLLVLGASVLAVLLTIVIVVFTFFIHVCYNFIKSFENEPRSKTELSSKRHTKSHKVRKSELHGKKLTKSSKADAKPMIKAKHSSEMGSGCLSSFCLVSEKNSRSATSTTAT